MTCSQDKFSHIFYKYTYALYLKHKIEARLGASACVLVRTALHLQCILLSLDDFYKSQQIFDIIYAFSYNSTFLRYLNPIDQRVRDPQVNHGIILIDAGITIEFVLIAFFVRSLISIGKKSIALFQIRQNELHLVVLTLTTLHCLPVSESRNNISPTKQEH